MGTMRYRLDVAEAGNADSMGLLGSCVARDLRTVLFPNLSRSTFLWRINTVSLVAAAPSRLDLAIPEASPEERLTLDRDINKQFDLDGFFRERFILLDFFRDTYSVARLADGRWITVGLEFEKLGLGQRLDVAEVLTAHDARYPALWLSSLLRFAQRANASGAGFIIQPVIQTAMRWQDDRFVASPPEEAALFARNNQILGHMQRIALAALHRACLMPAPAEPPELDPAHEFGPGPLHASRRHYERSCELVRHSPDVAVSLPTDETTRRQVIDTEILAWQRLVQPRTA